MLWRAQEHEELAVRAWDETRARAALREIAADAEEACAHGFWPGHPGDETAEEIEQVCLLPVQEMAGSLDQKRSRRT
jgi:hypothetical protein